jgi:hypothetical protein
MMLSLVIYDYYILHQTDSTADININWLSLMLTNSECTLFAHHYAQKRILLF